MQAIMDFITAHLAVIMGVLGLIINEVFAANPALKSNSLVQFLLNLVGLMPKSMATATAVMAVEKK